MEELIQASNIFKTFKSDHGKRITAVENINLDINSGDFFILLGPSGCGKSTLLRILSGLEKSFRGKLNFNKSLNFSDFSFVFQQFALLPWLTVYQNVELGLLERNLSEKQRREIVSKELIKFGLEEFSKNYPKELSGGMRQRVGLARAFATNPKVIFMDEPFSELDSFTASNLRKDVLEIWGENKPTIVMVTHLIQEAIEMGDKIAVMTKSPGTIEKIFINELKRPRNKRSEGFFELEDKIAYVIKP